MFIEIIQLSVVFNLDLYSELAYSMKKDDKTVTVRCVSSRSQMYAKPTTNDYCCETVMLKSNWK